MNRERKRLWATVILASGCLLACWIGYSYFRSAADQWVTENMSRRASYTMPAAAQIIDQYTSELDFFGDFIYCASFRVSDPELSNLLSKGFDWIQAESWGTPTSSLPRWQTGQLPHEMPTSACDNLKPWLDKARTYRYLFAREEHDAWMILLAVDETEKIVFYFRGSW